MYRTGYNSLGNGLYSVTNLGVTSKVTGYIPLIRGGCNQQRIKNVTSFKGAGGVTGINGFFYGTGMKNLNGTKIIKRYQDECIGQ